MNGKVATLSQDVFRLLSNSNWAVTREEKVEMLDKFCGRLEMSGYPVELAAKIVLNGVTCYERKVKKASDLKVMFHRRGDQGRLERRRSKITGMSSWFRPQKCTEGEEKLQGSLVSVERVVVSGGKGMDTRSNQKKVTKSVISRKPEEIRVAAPLFQQATKDSKLV